MVIALVHETHNSQFDKGGKPYVLHPLTYGAGERKKLTIKDIKPRTK